MKITLSSQLPAFQLDWRNDPAVYRFTRQNGPIPSGKHEAWLARLKNDSSVRMFGIVPEELGYAVGTVGLTGLCFDHRSAEFSLLIGPPYQKKGYGGAALKEILRYGFEELQLNSIWGESLEGNPAIEMFLKLGFKEEGWVRERYFKEDKYQDAIIVSMLRSEFYKLKGEW